MGEAKKRKEAGAPTVQPKLVVEETDAELMARAFSLYAAPFNFKYGYIHDGNGEVTADDRVDTFDKEARFILQDLLSGNTVLGAVEGDFRKRIQDVYDMPKASPITRIRGWGRMQYMPTPEELQDAIGKHVARALTEYWERHSGESVVVAEGECE